VIQQDSVRLRVRLRGSAGGGRQVFVAGMGGGLGAACWRCATTPQARVSLAGLPTRAGSAGSPQSPGVLWPRGSRQSEHYDPSSRAWTGSRRANMPKAAGAEDDTKLYAVSIRWSERCTTATRTPYPGQVGPRKTACGHHRIQHDAHRERWVVSEVLADSPAAEAGVRTG